MPLRPMTSDSMTPALPESDLWPDAPKPYATPSLVPLGTVETVTAGPVADGGNIDQLVGLVGGFGQGETTS